MKKLITVILILALFLPAAAIAEEKDPIIGDWYVNIDMQVVPELQFAFPQYQKLVSVMTFSETGQIMSLENVIQDGVSNQQYVIIGKWEKTDDRYRLSFIGYGDGAAYFQDGKLWANIAGHTSFFHLRQFEYFSPYYDLLWN